MTAESYKTILNMLTTELGGSETAAHSLDVMVDIATGGKNIGKNLVDDKIIRAVIESGLLSTDMMEALQAYEKEFIDSQKQDAIQEQKKIDIEEEKDKKEKEEENI